jgi:hypothetical protein
VRDCSRHDHPISSHLISAQIHQPFLPPCGNYSTTIHPILTSVTRHVPKRFDAITVGQTADSRTNALISKNGSGRDRYFTWARRRFWTNDTTSVNKEKARLSHQPSRLPKRRAPARTVKAHRPATPRSPTAQIHTQRGCWPN